MRLLSWGRGVWGLAGLLVLASAAQAQANWPDRPVRVIVPFPASGATDLVARVVTQRVAQDLGQQLVVDNKPGGNTAIAASDVAVATFVAPEAWWSVQVKPNRLQQLSWTNPLTNRILLEARASINASSSRSARNRNTPSAQPQKPRRRSRGLILIP